MAEKKTELSIVLRTVDKATAGLKAINARVAEITKPIHDFKSALGDLRKNSGIDDVIGGFKGVGSAVGDVLGKLALVGGVAGVAVAGLLGLVKEFDDLGDKADRLGVSVDFLAQLRYAAEKTGAPVESLDQGLETFSVNLGKAQAGTGRMAAFLKKVNPEFLKQLQHAKSNEEAFGFLADALEKETDAARRSALANAALGDPKLAPLLAKGSKGIAELRAEHLRLAGSLKGAADAAGDTDDSLINLHAATDGVKGALIQGLSPALTKIIKQLTEWLSGHRAQIAEWATSIGTKLPGAVNSLVATMKSAVGTITSVVDSIGGIKTVAIALAGILVGPLLSAIVTLGIALLTTPVGWILAGLAAIGAAAYELIKHWDAVSDFFIGMWDVTKAKFGWATTAIRILLFPFIGIPELIITGWRVISGFFGALWDDVTSVFKKGWELIKPIVDKVLWAAGKLADLKGFLIGGPGAALGGLQAQFAGGDASAQAQAAVPAGGGVLRNAMAHITVDFANMPRGGKVSVAPQSTADVDLSVGYNLLGATP